MNRRLALLTAVTLAGCASTTTIRGTPSGATVFVDNQRVDTTPCEYCATGHSGAPPPRGPVRCRAHRDALSAPVPESPHGNSH
ncbi:hypothetical protein JY651_36910 [Pyxidicoccus parkwayensis]|uniref:Lipoprotein n=1 Tax=Pyxidicoccus parkwayensis TaxID=2813578 RepID=A0ABX7NPK5_9BACT|nr:hypothetical protein [Pyxidicoccus parkwaysis]QSQ20771.1 hypothetical protein JY651_36910 [Pyxidicoccus parkwaysis]